MHKTYFIIIWIVSFAFISCKKKLDSNEPSVNFIFQFDSTQERLNNVGVPAGVASGNKAQSPVFNMMSAHYLELSPGQFTTLGNGDILYKAPETSAGGANAIDFSKAKFAGDGGSFIKIPLKDLTPGSYNWLRISLAYQNYTIKLNTPAQSFNATVASFIGFSTYIQNFKIKDSTLNVNENKSQGFWALEASSSGFGIVE